MKILKEMMENNNYLEDFITRSTYHSNAIEGSTLTYAETYAILFNDNSFKINNKEPREIYEAINHKKAMAILFEKLLSTNPELDENFIKKLNETINQDIKNTTGYRKVTVLIKGSEHIPPKPEHLNTKMMYFVYNYNHDTTKNIFYKIANYHLEFENIHPFEDGNGRTGRLLMNFELLKNNIHPIVIPIQDRTKYFEFLKNKDVEGLANWFQTLSEKEKERMTNFS